MTTLFLEKLSKIANKLDNLKLTNDADSLTSAMTKIAEYKDHEVDMAKNELSTAMRAIEDLMKALPKMKPIFQLGGKINYLVPVI